MHRYIAQLCVLCDQIFTIFMLIKGIFSDFHNIFLWHESEDKKAYISQISGGTNLT